jgi:hypothetical protein
MILSPEVLTIEILDVIFLLFSTVAFILAFKISLKWDINSTTKEQYMLEKNSFLGATIIKYILAIKIPLFFFFIFTLDKISNLLTGAMCSAGVIDATDYGIYLLILKLFNLYIFGFWLILHYLDIKSPSLPHTKLKFEFFTIIYWFLVAEIVIEIMMFNDIDINKMVSCCGTLYSSSANSAIGSILNISTPLLLGGFYGIYLLLVLAYRYRVKYTFGILNLLFLVVSLISLISFFGTYIYELPTHHCPFCFLQKDYYFVGYFIYFFLFVGTFYGISSALLEKMGKDSSRVYRVSLIFNTLYLILVSSYPIVYFLKNGVWLS